MRIFQAAGAGGGPKEHRARTTGLALAMVMRILLLLSISWVIGLTEPLFAVVGREFSGRSLILSGGGLFLIGKSTFEIHEKLEGEEAHDEGGRAGISFAGVITQIVLLDLVFSLDSVITAVGMAEDITVMIIAVVVAVGIMLVSARAVSDFVNEHPTVKMLALAFLLLIGTTLVAEGLEFHIPKGYVYFAMGFSVFVEFLNLRARRRRRPPQPIELRPTSSRSARPPVRSVTSSSAATQRRGSTSQEGPRRPDDVDTQCTLAPARPASGGPVPPDGAAVGLHRRASAWWTGQRVSGVMARHRDRLPKGAS